MDLVNIDKALAYFFILLRWGGLGDPDPASLGKERQMSPQINPKIHNLQSSSSVVLNPMYMRPGETEVRCSLSNYKSVSDPEISHCFVSRQMWTDGRTEGQRGRQVDKDIKLNMSKVDTFPSLITHIKGIKKQTGRWVSILSSSLRSPPLIPVPYAPSSCCNKVHHWVLTQETSTLFFQFTAGHTPNSLVLTVLLQYLSRVFENLLKTHSFRKCIIPESVRYLEGETQRNSEPRA